LLKLAFRRLGGKKKEKARHECRSHAFLSQSEPLALCHISHTTCIDATVIYLCVNYFLQHILCSLFVSFFDYRQLSVFPAQAQTEDTAATAAAMMIKLGTLSATTNHEMPGTTKKMTPSKRKRKTTGKSIVACPPSPAPGPAPATAKVGSPGRAKRTPRKTPAVAQYSPHKPLKPILLPLRTYAKTAYIKPSYRQMYCPVVKGIAVTGGSRGMQFQFLGFEGGIQFRGRGLRQAPAPAAGAGGKGKLKGKAYQIKAKATTAAASTKKKKLSSPSNSRTPVSRIGQSGATTRTPRALSYPTTPNRSGCQTHAETTSLPILKTPSRLTTQSAKRSCDALLEASPLALLADAAEMESPHRQTMSAQFAKGTQSNAGGSISMGRDVTPSPDKESRGAAAWSSRAKTPTSIPTFGGEEGGSDIVSPPPTKGKRYSIRPKDKTRLYGAPKGQRSTASTPLSLLADMLHEEESLPISSDDKPRDGEPEKSSTDDLCHRHHRPSTSSASADLAQGAAALAAVMTGKVGS